MPELLVGMPFLLIWDAIIVKSGPQTGTLLHESAPCISVMRSMPGKVEANITWLQVGLNSAGPGMCRASSPVPWRGVDGGMNNTAMVHFQTSTRYKTKQVKPSGTVGFEQSWTICETSHFCVGHVLTVTDSEDATQVGTISQRHRPWLTLPLSLSSSILKDRQDIHRTKVKLGGHGYTVAPDVVIQLCHAVPHDCYSLEQLCFTTVN